VIEKIIIKNYLLLKDIEIYFSGNFNIITGETGAGKSILINAISLLLGERADYSLINKNSEKMVIEGFVRKTKSNKNIINNFIKVNEIENIEDYLIIRRELYSKGYSRNFINDTPVNINDMKIIGDSLIDIHSQNEHQSLLKKEMHIEMLDSFLSKQKGIDFEKELIKYKEGYSKLKKLDHELEEYIRKKSELENKRNYLEFQLKEIKDADPKLKEDENLEKELKIVENVEIIQQGLASAYSNLYDGEGSAAEKIKQVQSELEKIRQYNDEIKTILKDIEDSSAVFGEASRQIYALMSTLSFDPQRIEEIRERLYKLQFLKKKYGGNLESVIQLKEAVEKDLLLLENFDERLKKVQDEISDEKEQLFKRALLISKMRKERSKDLEKEVVGIFKDIGFEFGEFKVDVQNKTSEQENNFTSKIKNANVKLTDDGIDDVEFLVKINKGDEFSSLRKTASGGEISRIMLAIKTVLADADKIDVLIFDEIDIGISGRIAQKVGRVLKKLSNYHQVISITHLAQIAALAEDHFLVEKAVEGNSTFTKIKKLDKNERVIELAKLLSGEKVTDAAIRSAKELIGS
jgi:DNA repair protein RecN (Recombination protein N)